MSTIIDLAVSALILALVLALTAIVIIGGVDICWGIFRDYWGNSEPDPMLKKALDDFIKDNREEIIDKAADKLAERLSRTKIVKEAAAKKVMEE